MRYYKITANGYLHSIGTGGMTGEEITQREYENIENVIRNAPAAPDGYAYVLTESLEWELVRVEMPEIIEEATDTDYQAALEEMGCSFHD